MYNDKPASDRVGFSYIFNLPRGCFIGVSISKGNSKLGSIYSVSLPPLATCRECACNKKCYALRYMRRRKNVREAYQNNLKILNEDPDTYWREVEAAIMVSRYFRFHVAGDIPSYEYFEKMVTVAERNAHCKILCFTKKYEIVNEYITNTYMRHLQESPCPSCSESIAEIAIPSNLHVIFSVWKGLEPPNVYYLPEAHVRYRDGTTTAGESAIECLGNCTECAITDDGCWNLGYGEQVVFNEH